MKRTTVLLALGASIPAVAADFDGDGLGDSAEQALGTDPAWWDTDGDRVSDGAEIRYASDPLVDDTRPCAQWAETPITLDPDALYYSRRAADVDGDGDLDVVGVPYDGVVPGAGATDAILWYENLGGGAAFAAGVALPSDGIDSYFVHPDDLDGDGDVDLVSSGWTADGHVAAHLNLGGGVFAAPLIVMNDTADNWVGGPTTADLDGDGDPEIVAPQMFSSVMGWVENLGGGAFGPVQWTVNVTTPYSISAADLDADGLTDLLGCVGGSVGASSGIPRWFPNLGGVFAQVDLEDLGGCGEVVPADLDADGDTDLVVGRGFTGNGPVGIVTNLGGGAFALEVAAGEVGEFGEGVRAADFDADGDLDVVYATPTTDGDLRWVENEGAAFGAAYPIAADGPAENFRRGALAWIDVGDFDGDGLPDVLAPSRGAHTAWFRNNVAMYVALPDGDLLPQEAELCIVGTDPEQDDTDGGGTDDALEVFDGSDPFDPADDAPASDADGDGITGFDEARVYGTSPNRVDTDGDGLADPDELAGGLDPASADTDDDGAEDGREIADGSDPFDPDTDDDGLPDGHEAAFGTDPLAEDTDLDGTSDLREVRYGTDPLGADVDSDADGLADIAEATVGTDPVDPDTDGDGLLDGEESGVCNPRLWDTDGDSLPDGGEVSVLHTDPRSRAECFLEIEAPAAAFEAAGDMDGDGDGDLLALFAASLRWFELVDGRFVSHLVATGIGSEESIYVEVADLDGDGDSDLILTDYTGANTEWYENLGGGTFAAAVALDTLAPYFPKIPTAADVDGDGDRDVLVIDSETAQLFGYENQGGGVFGGRRVVAVGGAQELDAADLDGDGDVDLARTNGAGTEVGWWENVGGWSFVWHVLSAGGDYHEVAVADFDSNGRLDVAFGDRNNLWWARNDGAAWTVELFSTIEGSWHVQSITAADFDRDGRPDLGVGFTQQDTNGEGLFVIPNGQREVRPEDNEIQQSVASYVTPVLAADLDGNGTVEAAWDDVAVDLLVGDADGDGLGSRAEVCTAGTAHFAADTDGGGVDDRAELAALTDPLDPTDD